MKHLKAGVEKKKYSADYHLKTTSSRREMYTELIWKYSLVYEFGWFDFICVFS